MRFYRVVFVFIICSLMCSCFFKSKSRLAEDGEVTLTINGSSVEGWADLNGAQKDAVLGGTYTVNFPKDYQDNCGTLIHLEEDIKDGNINVDFYNSNDDEVTKDKCKTYLKDLKDKDVDVSLVISQEVDGADDKELLKADKARITVNGDKINFDFKLVKQKALTDIKGDVSEPKLDKQIKARDEVILYYNDNGDFKLANGVTCCVQDSFKDTGESLSSGVHYGLQSVGVCSGTCSPPVKIANLHTLDIGNFSPTGEKCKKDTDNSTNPHVSLSYKKNEENKEECYIK